MEKALDELLAKQKRLLAKITDCIDACNLAKEGYYLTRGHGQVRDADNAIGVALANYRKFQSEEMRPALLRMRAPDA